MAESIKKRVGAFPDKKEARELQKLLAAMLVDLTALRTAVAALISDHNTLATKLNADAGVTDTNYAASTATATTLTTTA